MTRLFNRVVIVGVGLIGSSLGMNFIKKKLAREVVGIGRNQKNLQEAIRRRAIDRSLRTGSDLSILGELTEDDLVILATPVKGISKYFNRLSRRTLVVDVGSTKASIVRTAAKKGIRFVGSHPIAGTEKSGAKAGEMDLFQNKRCVLTPTRLTHKADIRKVQKLWEQVGARVILMTPEKHDRLFAVTSHLPHVVATTLIGVVASLVPLSIGAKLSLGGLKGTTRIASSPPEMWRDIFLDNRGFLLKGIDQYLKDLKKLRSWIARREEVPLFNFLKKSQRARLQLTKLDNV